MEKLNRLGWTEGISFEVYGLRFGIRFNDASILDDFMCHLPIGWEVRPYQDVDVLYSLWVAPKSRNVAQRNYHVLYYGSTVVVRTLDFAEVYDNLKLHSENLLLTQTQGYLFVQAGVVMWQGQAIVLPGQAMTGKTTMVKALLDAGASYYSDRYAVFDSQGFVHAYPVPLDPTNETGSSQLSQYPPLPVGLILVTTYHRGAVWRPKVLSPAQGLLVLMSCASSARRVPTYIMPILREAVSSTRVIMSERNEALPVVGAILQIMTS